MKELKIEFPPILEQTVSKTPPWIMPTPNVCFEMENFPKNKTPTAQIKAEFHRHKHDSNIDIYTDGSKTGTGVGAGIATLLEKNKLEGIYDEIAKPLSNNSTILSAELKAISIGLDCIAKDSDKTLTIYSDSKGALQCIMQYNPKNPLTQEIQAKLSRAYGFNNKITFCWVPSHRGILGNELADKQANIASKKYAPTDLPVVAKDLNSYITKQGKKWLQNQWDFLDRNKLHIVDNEIGEKIYHKFHTRLDEIKYNRIRLGHTRLTNKYMPGEEDPPICIICNRRVTIHHIFTNCRLHLEARKKFFGSQHNNIQKILDRKTPENCTKVINFLKYTQLYSEI